MHSHSLTPTRVAFCDGDEVTDDLVLRARAIRELHLVNVDRMSGEVNRLIQFVVQSKDTLDVQVDKGFDKVIRPDNVFVHYAIASIDRLRRVLRRREGYDLIRNYPAEVTLVKHLLELEAVKGLS